MNGLTHAHMQGVGISQRAYRPVLLSACMLIIACTSMSDDADERCARCAGAWVNGLR